jgi:hypothetical protein
VVTTEDYLRFGVSGEVSGTVPADANGRKVVSLSLRCPEGQKDRGSAWLRNAMIALGFLALASAVVSFTAQYRLVFASRRAGNSVEVLLRRYAGCLDNPGGCREPAHRGRHGRRPTARGRRARRRALILASLVSLSQVYREQRQAAGPNWTWLDSPQRRQGESALCRARNSQVCSVRPQ